jgi:DNA-binding transcriptional MerR regulator
MNKTPIPEANPEANVHQLAARNKELEERVAELEAKIRQLEEEKNSALMVSDKGPMTMEELMVGHA